MKLRFFSVLSLMLIAAVFAGCGDTADKNAYVDKVNKAQTEFNSASQKIVTEFSAASSAPQAAKAVEKLKTQFDSLSKTLKDIDAPNDKIKPLHEQLIQTVETASKGVGQASTDLQSVGEDTQKIVQIQLNLSKTMTETSSQFSKTIAEINQQLKK